MNSKTTAKKIYHKFSNVEGNQHIASDYGLEVILTLVNDFKTKNILEVGLGIGSICDAILTYSKENSLEINYTGTEANDFCLNALQQNVSRINDVKLFSYLEDVVTANKFDFIIIDGSDDTLSKVEKLCTPHALIFIEGGRASQIATLKQVFPKAISAEIISMRRPPAYGPFDQKWSGGGTLIFINPTFRQKQYRFKEKVKTYLTRRLRKFIK